MSKLSGTDITKIKSQISSTLSTHARMLSATALSLLPVAVSNIEGKLYEAHVLAYIIEQLVTVEKCTVTFVSGSHPMFKQKGGVINLSYPHFDVVDQAGTPVGKLLTDIYFHTLSYQKKKSSSRTKGDYHELDIALVKDGITTGKPTPDKILIAVECKNTKLHKHIIRELLGFRRELSYVDPSGTSPTGFSTWPMKDVAANPPSVNLFFTTHPQVTDYEENCRYFSIVLYSYKMI
jgi:hypothetical protein